MFFAEHLLYLFKLIFFGLRMPANSCTAAIGRFNYKKQGLFPGNELEFKSCLELVSLLSPFKLKRNLALPHFIGKYLKFKVVLCNVEDQSQFN